jgi:hypothetical protein
MSEGKAPFFVAKTQVDKETVQRLGVERVAEEMAQQIKAAVLERRDDLERCARA